MSSPNQYQLMFLCPFCGSERSEDYNICCGEYGHCEWVYANEDGETLSIAEYQALEAKYDKEAEVQNVL